MSFFALLVLVGSVYHVAAHESVAKVLEDLKNNKTQHVYEQVVYDEKTRVDDAETKLSTVESAEKCIGAGESDIRYPAEEPPSYEEPNGSVTKADQVKVDHMKSNGTSNVSNGTTKLTIEDKNHGSKQMDGQSLGKFKIRHKYITYVIINHCIRLPLFTFYVVNVILAGVSGRSLCDRRINGTK